MRKRLRRMVIAVVVLSLGAVGFLVGRSMWQQHQRELLQRGLEFLPGVSQHIQHFRRVKVQDGRTVWEVSAEDARYFEDEKLVVVRDASMQWHMEEEDRQVGLQGDEGRIVLAGREIARVELSGDIQVTLGEYLVRTDRAAYDHASERISAPGAVEILGRALRLQGEGMDVDVQARRLTLLRNVSMRLEPEVPQQGGSDAPP